MVTGAAGFIGSHLVERLLQDGYRVLGLDAYTDYYYPFLKKQNIRQLLQHPNFSFIETDILNTDLPNLTRNIDYIFHLAAQPGVRASWGEFFAEYLRQNVLTTQKLLEAVKKTPVKKLVYASSSSIYGNCQLPVKESTLPKPISPYGVTKLAAEQMCFTYWHNYQVPVVALRYFTVYGPRQRPDMAISKLIRCLAREEVFNIYGSGKQTRDFTYVGDIVEATVLAAKTGTCGEAINIGGGSRVTLLDVIEKLQNLSGKRLTTQFIESRHGDPADTWADIEKSRKILGYTPQTTLTEGLLAQLNWFKKTHNLTNSRS